MKQLLIVKSSTALNGGATKPSDLSGMAEGSIGFFALNDYSKWLSATPSTNFGIALGGGANKTAFVIPEVDVNTLTVTETTKADGVKFKGEITIPTTAAGKTYTLVLVKLGTGINGERNKWSQSISIPAGGSKAAADVAKALGDGFQAMADAGSIDVKVTVASAKITIEALNFGDEWKLTAGDDLYGTAVTNTSAEPAIGDKAFVQKLARECAGNKGFLYTDLESQHIYPGYPEAVEDTTYNIFNLRFATGRVAGKQTDERIWQQVHIAVPSGSAALATIRTILSQPVLPNAASAASGS